MKFSAAVALCLALGTPLSACSTSEPKEITAQEEVKKLAGSCAKTVVPMFLVRRTRPEIEAESLLRFMIVRPGALFAPFTVEAYERGEAQPDELAEIVRVIPADTRLEVQSVWSLESFEGHILSVSTSVNANGGGVVTADMASLLETTWKLDLADGKISEFEKRELRGRPLYDPGFAVPCGPD